MTEAIINTIPLNGRMGTEITIQVVERVGGPQYTVTIPRTIAEAMGFQKGEAVDLSIRDGQLIIQRKVPQEADPSTK